MKAYQLKITIKDSHPPIWRRVIVPAGLSFSQLSVVLNGVMDWSGAHLFSFEFWNLRLRIEEMYDNDFVGFGDMDQIEASDTIIDEYLDQEARFTYIYDFGDDWRHAVVVEKIIDDYENNYPVVLKYKGETPIEDCGGIYGFYDKQRILENPSDPEYEEISEWAPCGVTEAFDLEEMNERLKNLYLTKKKSKPMRKVHIYSDIWENKGFKQIQGTSGLEEYEMPDEFPQFLFREEDDLKSIFRDYNKEDLVELAKLHHLGGYSKFNKEDLINFLVYCLLDKDVMCRYFTFLSDEELALIDKFSDVSNHVEATEKEMQAAMALFEGGYAGSRSFYDIVVPKDVAQAYKKNCNGEWRRLRREALELSYYLNASAELYGICPMEKALELYRKYTGKAVEELTMYNFCEMIPENKKAYIFNGVQLIHKNWLDDKEREELEKEQQGKPFYTPTQKEILTLGKDGYFPFDDSMKALESFLSMLLGGVPGDAEYLCRFIQFRFRVGADIEEIMDFMLDNDILDEIYDRAVIEKFKQLLVKAWHRTRKVSNRGNLPKGMTRQDRMEQTLGAESLNKGNVVQFPIDIKKKIYPNDPCPCGSGKKYKKCCGKNKRE